MASIRRRRWVAKKVARHGLVLAATLARALMPGSSPAVRAIVYHRFGESSRDPFCVSVDEFESQMRWVAERGLAVSLDAVERFVAGEAVLPDNAVLVTVDDGCQSLYTEALPVLREHAIPAVAFVPAAHVEMPPDAGADEPNLTWDQLGLLAEHGVTIGSHGFHHRSFAQMSIGEAADAAVQSRALLEERLGLHVTSFAYPFGTRADFNDATGRVLREAGYRVVFTSQHGPIRPGIDPGELPRVKVEGGEADWMFREICHGAMDSWRVVDQLMAPLQRHA